jgi:hypothetical protein
MDFAQRGAPPRRFAGIDAPGENGRLVFESRMMKQESS